MHVIQHLCSSPCSDSTCSVYTFKKLSAKKILSVVLGSDDLVVKHPQFLATSQSMYLSINSWNRVSSLLSASRVMALNLTLRGGVFISHLEQLYALLCTLVYYVVTIC